MSALVSVIPAAASEILVAEASPLDADVLLRHLPTFLKKVGVSVKRWLDFC